MSTEEKNLDTVKLSRIEHFVATVRRTVKEEDIDICSVYVMRAFLFPRVWENVRSALTQEYINGYNDAKKEMENAD